MVSIISQIPILYGTKGAPELGIRDNGEDHVMDVYFLYPDD